MLGWLGLLLCLLLAACGKAPLPVDEKELLDCSSSDPCDARTVRAAAVDFLNENNVPGSSFEVHVVGCDVGDVAKIYVIKVPEWGPGATRRKKQWQDAELERLKGLTLPAPTRCSAIAASLWSVARLFREREGAVRRLLLVSDLREIFPPLHLNLERRIPSPQQFVARLKKGGILADLDGIDVSICGVHNRPTPDAPRWGAENSNQRDVAWSAALEAMRVHRARLNESCSFGAGRPYLVASGAVP
jgi:hypothetical protein